MSEEHEDGIVLGSTFPLDDSSPIDWDVVLRDFAWAHALSEQEEHDRELAEQNDPILHLVH